MFFHSKMAWYPATYDVISRNRRNWPSLNLSQNAREEQINNFWKRQVLMFYPLGKYSKKPQEEGAGVVSTISSLVRPRVNLTMFVHEQISQGKVFDAKLN